MKHLRISLIYSLFLFAATLLNAAEIVRGPYVEAPQNNTATINWQVSEASPSWIEYGPQGKCSQIMALSSSKYNHTLPLYGLIPNTKFCYTIYVENSTKTGVQEGVSGEFSTLYTPERKILNFLVIGNTSDAAEQSTNEIKDKIAAAMESYDADFIIHTGDIVSTGANEDSGREFFTPFRGPISKAALLIALGEDEYGPNRADKSGRGFLKANYRKIHTMPWSRGTPSYYYVDTANARIIFIDTNNVYGVIDAPALTAKSTQYEWLRSALSSAGSDKWKIVVMHHPVYSSGKEEDKLSSFLAPLFEAYRVNLVIQGHQGAYERTKPIVKGAPARSGPIYVTVGGGGKLFEPMEYQNEWGAKYYETPHFAQISIVDRKLSLRVYTHENKKIDSLDLYF